MFRRQTTQDALAFMFMEDVIDEVEFLMLFETVNKKNPSFPFWSYDRFDLTRVTEEECKAEFRFGLAELPLLAKVLAIPDTFVCRNGTVATGIEGLCILLRRFAYPCRLSDLIPRFGRSVPELSEIISEVSSHIFDNYGYLLRSLDQPWLQPNCLQRFADAIYGRGSALSNCWGFVDGTVRPIARPGEHQRVLYNGHKRVHALKFQSVVAPNGLIANLYGPVEGRRHDAGMLRMSGLLTELNRHAYSPTAQPLCIYGDPAYPLRIHLQAPYRNAQLTAEQQVFNSSMSTVRTAVEWVFGDISTYFALLDFKRNLKIGLSPVGKLYSISALLRNALTCLYGNTTSTFFNLDPPTIEEYFQY